ncbi:MAG: LptA/OstA family protein, partial [Terriglobales bacterium]
VQVDSRGRATPVTITSARLTYTDAEREVVLSGGVTTKGSDATMTARQMTVYLVSRNQCRDGNCPVSAAAGQVDKIVAEKDVAIVEPSRRATGDRLIYTASDEKCMLTGGPPSIFDAEHGKITGDSLTFYRHDDRVVVEGKTASPAVTKTQVAR